MGFHRSHKYVLLLTICLVYATLAKATDTDSCMGQILSTFTNSDKKIAAIEKSAPDYRNIYGLTDKENLADNLNLDLFELRLYSNKVTKELNDKAIAEVRAIARPDRNSKNYIPLDVNRFYERVNRMPEVSASTCGTYKGSGLLGFCWGRAFATHLQLLADIKDPRRVKKIWYMGDLREKTSKTKWRYHVATIVQNDDGVWYAIDPIFPRPLEINRWYQRMQEFNDTNARLIITDASRHSAYRSLELEKTSYLTELDSHGFFIDVVERVYFENTGRASPLKKIQSSMAKKVLLKRIIKNTFLPAMAVGGGYLYYEHKKK